MPPPPFTIRRFADPAAFLDAAGRFLLRHEVEHTVMLGVAYGLVRQPAAYSPSFYLATSERGGNVVAAALMTPPFNLTLSLTEDPTAHDAVAPDLVDRAPAPPGVAGPGPLAARFAAHWQQLTGRPVRPGMGQRLFRLERVLPVGGVPGTLRPATAADRDLLIAWMAEFTAEALGRYDRERAARSVDLRLGDPEGGLFLWEDGEPVSLVGYGGATPNTIRIAPVYTPPNHRNRGYATAATAAASRALLDQGRHACCLFTDLANPTSNHIYQKIGYLPILDVDEYRFSS